MNVPFLNEIIILFLISIVVNTLCSRMRLPATVGFLLTGVLCGPSLLSIVSDKHSVDVLAEMGVALLLFTIGMELSGEALAKLKKPVFLGGSLQVGLTVLVIMLINMVYHERTVQSGIFVGCLVALSSSAIVLRLLQEKGSTSTPHGKLTLAILVFQDIMVAPMLLLVPLLAGTMAFTFSGVLQTVGQMVLVMGGVLLFVHFGLNRLMTAVVRTRVRELLLLTTLGLCMGLALLTSWLGLSLSLGAFLAGLILARSEYSMSVVSGVMPYRDVFMSLFFISVGLLLDINFLWEHLGGVLGNTLVFLLIKILLILPAVLIQKYPLRTAIITAITLAQVGEFSFVLAASGVQAGLLDQMDYQSFLAMSIITMMLTPAMMHLAPRFATAVTRLLGRKVTETEEEPQGASSALSNHLIIVGFGISGKHMARAAKESGIRYEILEMNPDTVARYRGEEPIHYGDASQPSVLEHLGIKKARVMAIVISDPAAVRATIAEATNLNPGLRIVARTRFLGEVAPLKVLGASDVVAEELESSMEVFARVLRQYMVPKQDIDALSASIREEHYAMLRTVDMQNGNLGDLVDHLPDVGTLSLRLEENAPLCGMSLVQSALRRDYGVTVVAVNRSGVVLPSPDGTFVFEAQDVIYLFGMEESLARVTTLFLSLAPTQGILAEQS